MLSKRMLQAFGNVGGIGFIIMSFVVATGIAASPALLPRAGTAPGVYEARIRRLGGAGDRPGAADATGGGHLPALVRWSRW